MIEYKGTKFTGHKYTLYTLSITGFQSTIFEGPPGIGKTTLARIYVNAYLDKLGLSGFDRERAYQEVNGHNADSAFIKSFLDSPGETKILLINEFQYLTKKQQQLLLEALENEKLILIATTTENTIQFCHPAILSRCRVLIMDRPSDDEVLEYAVTLIPDGASFDNGVLESLVHDCNGDIRKTIKTMVNALTAANQEVGKCVVTAEIYENISGKKISTVTTESLKSALQKSIRGSDVDASCAYALAMLDRGDLEILCRRLRVIVSEDIGLSDLNAIYLVNACIDNALKLGMPEAKYPIVHAVAYMAMTEKSNTIGKIIEGYSDYSKSHDPIPPINISSEYAKGYIYPHSFKEHIVDQEYKPRGLKQIMPTHDYRGDEVIIVRKHRNRVYPYKNLRISLVNPDDIPE